MVTGQLPHSRQTSGTGARPPVEPPVGRSRSAKFIRYAMSSALATLVSAVTFAVAYRMLHLGPRVATVAAFAAGAVVNFVANRFWAWARLNRLGLGRDLISYVVLAVSTALAAMGATSAMDWYTHRIGATPNRQAVLVELGYFATYAAMFLVKFLLLDRLVFRSRR